MYRFVHYLVSIYSCIENMHMYLHSTRERDNNYRWSMNYRTQVIHFYQFVEKLFVMSFDSSYDFLLTTCFGGYQCVTMLQNRY